MPKNSGLNVEVGITLNKLLKQLNRAEARTVKTAKRMEDQFNRSTKRSAQGFKRIDRAVAKSSVSLNRFGGILAGALSVREIQRYGDAWTVAQNKIAAAGQVAGLAGRDLASINDIADRTRSGIAETADLYAKLLRATKGVAESELEVARATELVNKAFKAGGAAASEQAAGILQLGQGLSSGLLQGDELRSIRENAPLVAQAIADEFGVAIGALKELGSQGELTSERVFRAILNGQPKIEAAFAQTNATIGEGFTRLRNAITEYIGNADRSVGATEKIGKALRLLSDNLDIVAAGLGVLLVRGLTPVAVALTSRLAPAAAAASTALQLLTVRGGAAVVTMGVLRGALALLGGPVGLGIIAASGAAIAFSQIKDGAESFEDSALSLGETLGGLEGVNSSLLSDYQALKTALEDLAEAQKLGGEAAIAAAVLDVSAVQSRIDASAALRQERAILAQIELGDLKASLAAQEAEFIESGHKRLIADKDYARQLAQQKAAQGTLSEGVTDDDVRTFIAGEIQKAQAAAATGEAVTNVQRELLAASLAIRENAAEYEVARDNVVALTSAAEGLIGPLQASAQSTADIVSALDRIDFSSPISAAAELGRLLGQAAVSAAAIGDVKISGSGRGGDPREFGGSIADRRYADADEFLRNYKKPPVATGGSGGADTALPELFENADGQLQALQLQIDLIGKSAAETAKLKASFALLNEAKKRGLNLDRVSAETGQTLRQEIQSQADSIGQLTEKYEQASEQAEFFDQAQQQLKSGLIDAIVEGESLNGVLQDLAKSLAKAALEAALFNQGPFAGSGGGGGLLGGLLGGLFGGFRASGGPVNANVPYIVGERGPELVVPRSAGVVVPNGKFGGGGPVDVRLTVESTEDLRVVAATAGRQASVSVVQQNNRGLSELQRRA